MRKFLRRGLDRGEAAFYALPCPLCPGALRRRPGQNTVEYLLMLAVVASVTIIVGILFHKKVLGGIFTVVGMIIGAGTPT